MPMCRLCSWSATFVFPEVLPSSSAVPEFYPQLCYADSGIPRKTWWNLIVNQTELLVSPLWGECPMLIFLRKWAAPNNTSGTVLRLSLFLQSSFRTWVPMSQNKQKWVMSTGAAELNLAFLLYYHDRVCWKYLKIAKTSY